MKMRNVKLLLVLTVILLIIGTVAYADQPLLHVFINEVELQGKVAPQFINGELMLPTSEVIRVLNGTFITDVPTLTVNITAPGVPDSLKVTQYWSANNLKLPPIEGPDNFIKDVESAYELLKKTDYTIYRAAVVYPSSIALSDVGSNNAQINFNYFNFGTAAIMYKTNPTYDIHIDPEYYKEISSYSYEDTIKNLALTIAHETAHAQIFASGLRNRVKTEDDELFAIIAEYRLSENLEVSNDYKRWMKNFVKDYASKF